MWQLREAEAAAFALLPGTPVWRLATIAHSDGPRTTRLTGPSLVRRRNSTISTAAVTPAT